MSSTPPRNQQPTRSRQQRRQRCSGDKSGRDRSSADPFHVGLSSGATRGMAGEAHDHRCQLKITGTSTRMPTSMMTGCTGGGHLDASLAVFSSASRSNKERPRGLRLLQREIRRIGRPRSEDRLYAFSSSRQVTIPSSMVARRLGAWEDFPVDTHSTEYGQSNLDTNYKIVDKQNAEESYGERERNVDLSVLVATRLLRLSGTRAVLLGRESKGWEVGRKAVKG